MVFAAASTHFRKRFAHDLPPGKGLIKEPRPWGSVISRATCISGLAPEINFSRALKRRFLI